MYNNCNIVDILGSIDEKIENNKILIDKLSDYALLKVQFGAKNDTQLKGFLRFIKGKKPYENGTILDDYISIDGLESSTYTKAYVDKMVLSKEFDILMVMDGASSGMVYSHKKGIVSSTLAKIETSPKMNDYLYWFLYSMKDIIKTRNTGSAIPHANKYYIETLKFDYDLSMNPELTYELHTIREKIIDIQHNKLKLQELKHLYIRKFFG